METVMQVQFGPFHDFAGRARDLRRRIAMPLQRWGEELLGIWRWAKAREALARLPDDALRDLGIDRSEVGSFLAECDGRAARTRIRTAGPLRTQEGL